MAKEIKFNIKLNIDGKNVVVQASQSVKELQRNLMAAKTGSQRLGEAMLRINQVTQAYQNISSSVGALTGVMNTYIDKANASLFFDLGILRQGFLALGGQLSAVGSHDLSLFPYPPHPLRGGRSEPHGVLRLLSQEDHPREFHHLHPVHAQCPQFPRLVPAPPLHTLQQV